MAALRPAGGEELECSELTEAPPLTGVAQVEKLDASEPVVAGRKIQQLVNALSEVEQFHQFDKSLQCKQYLAETREYLMDMVRPRSLHARDGGPGRWRSCRV